MPTTTTAPTTTPTPASPQVSTTATVPATTTRLGRSLHSLPELYTGYWFLTMVFLLLGPALMAVLVTVDALAGEAGVFDELLISATSAQTILGAIAGSLVTVAALTSSLTVVTLQLLSQQFTPRALRGFLRSKLSQVVLGSLIGTFLYCLLVAVVVRNPADRLARGGFQEAPFVPSLAVTTAILLALVDLVLLVVFIHHLVSSIQVSNLAATIARHTRQALAASEQPDEPGAVVPDPGPGTAVHVLCTDRPGYIRAVDLDSAAHAVAPVGGWVSFRVRPGDFVTRATPILDLHCSDTPGPRLTDRLRRSAPVTSEREIAGDPAFGVRQLTDIALRAIAPGVNDPSTAVTCIGYIEDILVALAARPTPPRAMARHGAGVALADRTTFALYASSIVEIGRYARDARVGAALLDALVAAARAARLAGCTAHLDVLAAAADAVGETSVADARNPLDREQLHAVLSRFESVSARPTLPHPDPVLAESLVRAAEAGLPARGRIEAASSSG